MRRIWVAFGFVLVAAVGVGLSTTHTTGQPPGGGDKDLHRKITVTGVGTVSVKPDTARLAFGVRGIGADFKAAVAECDKKGAALEKAITDLKLGGLEIKKGPVQLMTMNAQNFFHAAPPFIAPPGGLQPMPMPPGGAGRLAPIAGVGNEPAIAFVNAQVNPQPPPLPVNPQPPAIQPAQPGLAPPPIGPPFPGGLQPQPFGPPMPLQPFPGMPGSGVEVVRSYAVVATFGLPGQAGELADIVKVTDKIQTAIVGSGGIESPVMMGNPPSALFALNGGNPALPGVVKIEFYRANPTTARQEALKLAVTDAVSNAKAAAGVANLTTKDIVALNEQTPQFTGVGRATSTGHVEVLGETEITVQVSVTFNY